MVLITQNGPETLPIGSPAPDFQLPATDGSTCSLKTFESSPYLVLCFTCNHCPYALGVEDRFIAMAREYQPRGVAFIAISANDAETYPQDSFPEMKKRAEAKHYPFPYCYDASQDVAKAYGAVRTPHLFVFNPERSLVYEGRIDDNWQDLSAVKSHDLRNALDALLAGQPVPQPQTNPMGCSIKWKKT